MSLLSFAVQLQFHAQHTSNINCERLVTRSGDGYFDAGPHENTCTESRPSSVGTTTSTFNIAQHVESGIAQWNAGLIDLMFNTQVEAARAQAGLLLKGRLHRIDIVTQPGQFSLDNASPEKITQLIQLGRGEAVKKANLDIVRSRFLNDTPAAKFEPLYRCENQPRDVE